MKPKTMIINGVEYIRRDLTDEQAPRVDGRERCIVRSCAAGVFIGYVSEKKAEANGVNITLLQAKRIHYSPCRLRFGVSVERRSHQTFLRLLLSYHNLY